MNTKQQIIDTFNFRHACKEFDPEKKIPDEDFNLILETGRLSPSSFGLEPWKFIVLQDPILREKIRPVCWGSQGQLPTASHYVILLARNGADMKYDSEHLRKYMENRGMDREAIAKRVARLKDFQENDFKLTNATSLFDWASKQTYIVLGNMMTAAAFLGIDSCPIEGFNREQLEKILIAEKILDEKHFSVSCMVAFGYRKNPPKPKIRQALDKIVEWVK